MDSHHKGPVMQKVFLVMMSPQNADNSSNEKILPNLIAYERGQCVACQKWTDFPDSKVQGANTGPIWVLSAPDGPHVCPMKCPIKGNCSNPLAWLVVLLAPGHQTMGSNPVNHIWLKHLSVWSWSIRYLMTYLLKSVYFLYKRSASVWLLTFYWIYFNLFYCNYMIWYFLLSGEYIPLHQ